MRNAAELTTSGGRQSLSPGSALTLAPSGRDGVLLVAMLREISLEARPCANVPQLTEALGESTSMVILAEEAVQSQDLRGVAAWVEAQPAWSDLPFIVLTRRGGGMERNPSASRLERILGNVSFIERPFHPTTLASAARTAARGRARQFEARALLEDLRDGEAGLKRLSAELEERVQERTLALSQTNEALLHEAAQRQEAERKLLQAQKMEAIGQLTGGIAHDFNNLLMAILGNVELLEKRLPGDPILRNLLANARAGAERGVSLTNRMLAFGGRQELSVAPTNIARLIEGMVELFKRSVGPKVQIVVEIEDALPPVLIDANQVELAVLNLVVNARDAMPDGGTIRISADLPDDAATAPADLNLDAVRVSVTDTGEGMNSETLAKAVEPFFSTKGVGKGTGLGLAMIHGLAAQMKGALRLESEVGVGTRAELYLPITDAAIEEPVERADPAVSEASRACRVLVVDDDALISLNAQMMAEDLGHDVAVAPSGDAALAILDDDSRFDVVITDYAMPRMTGAELAAEIGKRWPTLPVVIATGYAEIPESAFAKLERLSKPYTQDALADAIHRAISVGSR